MFTSGGGGGGGANAAGALGGGRGGNGGDGGTNGYTIPAATPLYTVDSPTRIAAGDGGEGTDGERVNGPPGTV